MSDLITPPDEQWMRTMLRSADVGPVPAPDVEALVAAGRRRERRTRLNRLAVAASVVAVLGLAVSLVTWPRSTTSVGPVAPPSAPGTASPSPTEATPTPSAITAKAFRPTRAVTKFVAVGEKVPLVGDAYLFLRKNGKCVVTPDGVTPVDEPAITQCRSDSGNQAADSVSMQGQSFAWPHGNGSTYYILTGLITSSKADTVTVELDGTTLPAGLVKLSGKPTFAAWYLVLDPASSSTNYDQTIVRVYAKDGTEITSLP